MDTTACGVDPWAFKPHVDMEYAKQETVQVPRADWDGGTPSWSSPTATALRGGDTWVLIVESQGITSIDPPSPNSS